MPRVHERSKLEAIVVTVSEIIKHDCQKGNNMRNWIVLAVGLAALAAAGAQAQGSFITTMDPDVTNEAASACMESLKVDSGSEVQVVGSESSEANTAIYMELASNGAPWRCLVASDGSGPTELMFMGTE
jgi:hypothetical protein